MYPNTRQARSGFETLENRTLLTCTDVCISEFMASNRDTLDDAFGESSDWIEIFNPTNQTVDLKGWRLTDDLVSRDKWIFPEATLVRAQSRILVWASGRDVQDASSTWHTNFKLRAAGEAIVLSRPDGTVAASFAGPAGEYPAQEADVSYGLDRQGREVYFSAPTPGKPNQLGFEGIVSDTRFSVDRGFFNESFLLQITTATPHATLIYTLDGSAPSERNGMRVTGDSNGAVATIEISSTATVRAMAMRDGWEPTNVDTQTYLFLDDVIRQTGDGLPDTWGHAGADYEMDPTIVGHPDYKDVMVEGLQAIPTLSLVMDIEHWFGQSGRGIYPQGQSSPRAVSVELLHADETEGVQVDGSVEIQGGSSTNRWKSDKLSMQLKFKREFGNANLDYPLFGESATDRFDTLVVDARLNQAWHYGGGSSATSQRERAQYTRDQFVADLQQSLGGFAPHGIQVHLYLNGIYWGIHNLHERPDEHFAAAYLGGDEDDYDIVKHNDDVVNGSFANYQALVNAINRDTNDPAQYSLVESMLDIDQFIDYIQINYFVGNTDWAHHNWYASFNKNTPDGRWRFHSWDAEHVLKGVNDDATQRDDPLGPTHIHRRLMRNDEYRLRFADAVQRNFFGDGQLTPAKAMAAYQVRLDEVFEALVPESARWGDNHRRRPFTRDTEWIHERDRLLNEYFPRRTSIVVDQMRRQRFFHRFDAPRLNVSGGAIGRGERIAIRGPGEIYYTIDGSDPRLSESRIIFQEPFSIPAAKTTVRVRALVNQEWSALVEATFTTSPGDGDFDRNGTVDAMDLGLLQAAVREAATDLVFDVNADESVDQRDIEDWLHRIAKTRVGDVDLNRRIDFADFLVLSANYGEMKRDWSRGDFSGDGQVDFRDFLLLSAEFGFVANGIT